MKDTYGFYTDKLKGDYRTVFDRVEMYVGTQSFDDVTKEEKLSQLLDVFLSAQEAGKPVNKIVGNNIEEFCKTFCSDGSFKNRILSLLDTFKRFAWLFAILSILDLLCADWTASALLGTESSVNISGSVIAILFSAVLAFITNMVVSKIMFKYNRISMRVLKGSMLIVAGLMFIGMVYLMESSNTNFITCPAWVTLACSAVFLILYYIFNYKRIMVEKSQKIKFGDMVNTSMRDDLDKFMEERYNNINKRKAKRGKAILTMKEFLDEDEKDCENILKSKMFYCVAPVVITVGAMVFTYFTGGFEGFIDAIIFLGIISVIEYFIMSRMWRFLRDSALNRKAWVQAKREELNSQTYE